MTPKDTQRQAAEPGVPHFVTRERFGTSQVVTEPDTTDEGPTDYTQELEAESGQFG